uniref:Uncharacterized protein n=1 Tax=Knipowitschia caucasica TaxID=637954 RepID=A0AAV2LMK2_KNICA
MAFTSWRTWLSETSLLTTFSKEELSQWVYVEPFSTRREVGSPFPLFGWKSKASPVFNWFFFLCATNFHGSIRLLTRHKFACCLQ